MKLRIQGNSLRIRVTRPELERLARDGRLVAAMTLGPGSRLEYALEIVPHAEVRAHLEGHALRVALPRPLAEQWFDEREVGVRATQSTGGGEELVILIEKDFECLVPREGEDQSDHFPNPART